MTGIDIDRYVFDYDLTSCMLLMHPDGRILGTYGGRDHTGPESHLSIASLVQALEAGAAGHGAAGPSRDPAPSTEPPRTVDRLWMRPKRPDCFHCHMVNEALHERALAAGSWREDDAWRWPDPRQVGWVLAKDAQTTVADVLPDSPAAAAGMRAGDRITAIEGAPVATFGDVQRHLDERPAEAKALAVALVRDGAAQEVTLPLPASWRRPTPLVFSWRATKWSLSPAPGFGGPLLSRTEKERLGIAPDAWAFRVNYLVTWGDKRHRGQAARKAGLRKGDVVVSVGGRDDFATMGHFHAWFRLTKQVGDEVPVVVLRQGTRRTLTLVAPR